MDLSKIKLIATDMDGTLLNSKGEVSSHFFDIFNEIKKLGITFVAASGRQYYSIIDKLTPIKDDIIVIAENGAITIEKDKEPQIIDINRATYLTILDILKKINGSQIILCGRKKSYITDYGADFINMFSEFYNQYEIIDDLSNAINDTYLKIAVYNQYDAEKFIYPYVKHLENDLKIKISGKNWLDLSHKLANKGHAIQQLQSNLNITPEETLVFGDYNNDLEMIQQAKYSFAMDNAHPTIINAANYRTKSNNEEGVEYILKQLISQQQKVIY